MRYREFAPGPALEGVVHRFWTLEGAARPGAAPERAMPDGRPELIFNLGGAFERLDDGAPQRQPAALLVGPTTRALRVRPTGRIDLVGVRLAPGRWPALLGVGADELLDRTLPLPEASRRWREDLLEPLAGTRSVAGRIALLERRLLRALARDPRGDRRPDPRLHAAVRLTLAGPRGTPVPRLAALAGVSERHLGRLFRGGTGMGPGLLGRLARFQRVLAELERPGPVHWAALAHRHGYADQAHLCRDFRRFGGISPARYLAAARDVARHFIDRDTAAEPRRDGRFVQDTASRVF